MSKISICLAAIALAFTALAPEPASAGARGGCVEGGYGLGWKGGRPYYYTPFGVYGGNCDQFRTYNDLPRKRTKSRDYSYR